METREIFDKLDTTDSVTARREFVEYLQAISQELESDQPSALKAAYSIAGMLATEFAHSLDENDPLMEIMTIAGELEIAPENTKDLQRELIDKIIKLK